MKPVGKSKLKYTDLSTEDGFRFAFRCDRCNAAKMSEHYALDAESFDPPPSGKALELLWLRRHSQAYARAASDAVLEFSVCPICGRSVCSDCFHVTDDGRGDMCLDCLEAAQSKATVFRWSRLTKKGRSLC